MVLLSTFPIDAAAARTFQHFLHKDMPGALLPTDPQTGRPWYSPDDLQVCRWWALASVLTPWLLVSDTSCPVPGAVACRCLQRLRSYSPVRWPLPKA